MMYNHMVEDCFFNARHAGFDDRKKQSGVRVLRYAPANALVRVQWFLCRSEDGTMQSIRYRVTGNPYIMAAVEWMARCGQGKKKSDMPSCDWHFWQKLLDIPRPQLASALQIQEIWTLLVNMDAHE
ncbi:MAG: hypothetical protein JJT82_00800 [Legionellaceae bacterium]|nr:hypothetical protein [Legionellaceae bacterium]